MAKYLTDINFMCIFGERVEIPTHTYQIHNSVINIFKRAGSGPRGCPPVRCVGSKRPSNII